jgi:hypothetical protein
MMNKRHAIDILATVLAVCYIIVPIDIFMFGWLKTVYAVIGCLFTIGLGILVAKATVENYEEIQGCNILKTSAFIIIVVALAAVWVWLSGIGSMAYQNDDYWVRNPIFKDLSTNSWPVIYDLSKESEVVQSTCGSVKVAFSYYFCWWLPVSAIAKLFGLQEATRNFLLYLWALLGILLVIYFLCRKMKKCSWIVPIVLIIFSGVDVIPYFVRTVLSAQGLNGGFFIQHMEWWAEYFQYSSNTTQLFWVFNQSIPIWLIMSIMIQMADAKYIAGWASLSFAYSPWATMGIIPYVLYSSFRKKEDLKSAINPFNVAIPIVMLVIFGFFYAGSTGSSGFIGLIFMKYVGKAKNIEILCMYLLFIIVEFGVYFVVMGKTAVKYEYFGVTLAELLIIPLLVVRDVNFVMRASIPALFMLMIYVMNYLMDTKTKLTRFRRKALIFILCCGMITPLSEIGRSVVYTFSSDDILQNEIGSFDDIQTDDVSRITTIRRQFFIYDYEQQAFFKYLSK